MYWFGHGVNGWGYSLMMFGFMAFAGLAIYGVYLLARRPGRMSSLGDSTGMSGLPQTPQQLLAARFARGEISEDDYTDRLATLKERARL